jgi:hypothetical protein
MFTRCFMGLDLLEFTLAIEDSFGVSIPDADLVQMDTPRRVIDYLVARLPSASRELCLEQRAFYRLREGVARAFGIARNRVRRDTPWQELLGAIDKRRRWDVLQHAVAVPTWPRLLPWGTCSGNARTVGATARYLGAYASSALKPSSEGWTRSEIARVVTALMGHELLVTEFTEDSRFVADLGCG